MSAAHGARNTQTNAGGGGGAAAAVPAAASQPAGAQALATPPCWMPDTVMIPPQRNATWIYLSSRPDQLAQSLLALYSASLCRFDYPVLIVYDDEHLPARVLAQVGHLGMRLTFKRLLLSPPPDVPPTCAGYPADAQPPDCGRYPSYGNMCRFWTKQVFELPELAGMQYYARLDDDSFIRDPIPYDVFHVMHREKKVYGFRAGVLEHSRMMQGLFAALEAHAAEFGIDVSGRVADWDVGWPSRASEANSTRSKVFYTNFEVVDIDRLYRDSPSVRALTERIDASRGAYWGRWGDAVVRTFALALHFNRRQDRHYFCDWTYEHQSVYERNC